MIRRINHIGIAVSSIDDAIGLYSNVLGLTVKEIKTVEDQKVKIAFIPVGESRIELLESTDREGPIARYIERKGEGIHHLALEVSNIQEALEAMSQQGMVLIDEKPRIGAGGHKTAFLHPKGTKVLIELVELSK